MRTRSYVKRDWNISGQKFGELTAVKPTKKIEDSEYGPNVRWNCKCDCGNKIITTAHNLMYGRTKSCGCLRRKK